MIQAFSFPYGWLIAWKWIEYSLCHALSLLVFCFLFFISLQLPLDSSQVYNLIYSIDFGSIPEYNVSKLSRGVSGIQSSLSTVSHQIKSCPGHCVIKVLTVPPFSMQAIKIHLVLNYSWTIYEWPLDRKASQYSEFARKIDYRSQLLALWVCNGYLQRMQYFK